MIHEPLEIAIKLFETSYKLAKEAAINRQDITAYRKGRKTISPIAALRIEKATGGIVKRNELLPDYDWSKLPS